ncbi:MAG TPA: hypothetical protein VGF24_29400 [Vicinamibacterales bacterium]|jgi:hypothetical protein
MKHNTDTFSPTEQALVRAFVRALVRELRTDKRPARLEHATGRDARDGDESDEQYHNLPR